MNFTKRTQKGRCFLKTISRFRPLWIRQPFIFTWVNKKNRASSMDTRFFVEKGIR
jgi:hypothetical protein